MGTTEQPPPKQRWRPRFSLLTLVLGVLFLGACGGLWYRWEPWVVTRSFELPNAVGRAALSPDGRSLFCLHIPNHPGMNTFMPNLQLFLVPCLWDTSSGQQVFRTELPYAYPESSDASWDRRFEAFSPSGEHILLWDFRHYGHISVFNVLDARTGLRTPLGSGHEWPVGNVAFSADGKRMLYIAYKAADEYSGVVVDLKTSRETLLTPPAGFIPTLINNFPCALSPDGRMAFLAGTLVPHATGGTGDPGSAVAVFNTETGRHLFDLPGDTRAVRQVCVSPDGLCLALERKDECVVYNTYTGEVRARLIGEHVSPCSFSPDSSRILAQIQDAESVVFDAATGQRLLSIPAGSSLNPLFAWQFSRNGKWLLGGHRSVNAIWDAADGRLLLNTVEGSVVPVPDERRAMVWTDSYGNGPAQLMDPATGEVLCVFNDSSHQVNGASFTDDGESFASSHGNCIDLWSCRRPERWWGIAWLPEFWIALLSGGALAAIAFRRLRARKVVKQEAA